MTLDEIDRIEAGLEGVTPGPWIRSGIQQGGLDQHGKFLAAGPDGALLFFSPIGKTGKEQATCIRDLNHIARLDPDTIRSLLALARRGLAAGDAAPATSEPVAVKADVHEVARRIIRDFTTKWGPLPSYGCIELTDAIAAALTPATAAPEVQGEALEALARIEHFAADPADGYVNGISKRDLREWAAAIRALAAKGE
jgi:hypothetical protein